MKFRKMLTNRSFMPMPSWQIVYEWEDDMVKGLSLTLKNAAIQKYFFDNPITRYILGSKTISDLVSLVDRKLSNSSKSVAFDLFPRPNFSYITSSNVVPLIIDFWKNTDLSKFYYNYKNCPFVCISSLEALNYLKEKKILMNFHHLPLSISDRYKPNFEEIYNKKKYDIILAGRENPVLEKYLEQYRQKNLHLNVVQRKIENGKINFYSSLDGYLGEFNSREKYFGLLKFCRVGFYSTPGIDGGENRTGGFNPVTPRFLELLVSGCRVIARYAKNADTDYYGMDNIVDNVVTYEDFERTLNFYLQETQFPVSLYEAYLDKYYTSNSIRMLNNIFQSYE